MLDDGGHLAASPERSNVDAAVAVEILAVVEKPVIFSIGLARIGYAAANLTGAGKALVVAGVVVVFRIVNRRIEVGKEVGEPIAVRIGSQ